MINGILDFSWWQLVLVALGMTHVTIVAVTVYLHRCQAHRALNLHPVLAHFFRFWLWMTTGMVTGEWVGVHRRHHARCESAEDPHSPQVLGLRKVLWEGAELYREAASKADLVRRYAHGTPDDGIERHLYSRYPILGVSVMLVIDFILFGILGIVVWAVQMIWILLCRRRHQRYRPFLGLSQFSVTRCRDQHLSQIGRASCRERV